MTFCTRIAAAALTIFAAACSGAAAAPPMLNSVGHQDRHPTGTFAAPGANDVTVYIASKPDRATDGSFLTENSESIDFLTDAEIASGRWLDADQLDPGTHYVMLGASTYECDDPAVCVDGYSEVLTLVVPKPKTRFKAKIEHGFIATFTLRATPLGESIPYRLCWRRPGGRKCVRSTIDGYDWNDAAEDSIYLTASDLKLGARRKTTVTWHVKGKRVASKRVTVRR